MPGLKRLNDAVVVNKVSSTYSDDRLFVKDIPQGTVFWGEISGAYRPDTWMKCSTAFHSKCFVTSLTTAIIYELERNTVVTKFREVESVTIVQADDDDD